MKTYPMTIQEALKDQPKLLEKVEETIRQEIASKKQRRNRDEKAIILQS